MVTVFPSIFQIDYLKRFKSVPISSEMPKESIIWRKHCEKVSPCYAFFERKFKFIIRIFLQFSSVTYDWAFNHFALHKRKDILWASNSGTRLGKISQAIEPRKRFTEPKPFKEPRKRFPALAGQDVNPIWRTGPPDCIGWRNRFLGIDSWAP